MEVVLQSAWSLPITIVFHKYPKYVHPHASDSIRVTHSHCAFGCVLPAWQDTLQQPLLPVR